MPGFRVTPRAQDDLKEIGRYTERQWGRSQRNTYLKVLEKRFDWLAENPRLGKDRPDVAEGYYSFPQGEHVVFYLMGERGIDIIGVPHKQMDIITYFLPDCTIGHKSDMPAVASQAAGLANAARLLTLPAASAQQVPGQRK